MKTYKQTKLEKIVLELAQVGEWYRTSERGNARSHYDFYANLLIENDVPIEYKENMFKYWEKLKNKSYSQQEQKNGIVPNQNHLETRNIAGEEI